MTPRDARKAAESWALTMHRAKRDGPYRTVQAYRRRWEDEEAALPSRELRDVFVAAYHAELRRLGEEMGP